MKSSPPTYATTFAEASVVKESFGGHASPSPARRGAVQCDHLISPLFLKMLVRNLRSFSELKILKGKRIS